MGIGQACSFLQIDEVYCILAPWHHELLQHIAAPCSLTLSSIRIKPFALFFPKEVFIQTTELSKSILPEMRSVQKCVSRCGNAELMTR